MTKKFGYQFKNEFGDEYHGGSWDVNPSKEEIAIVILKDHWLDLEEWMKIECDKTKEWAFQNPIESLSLCNINPTIIEL